MFLGIMSLNALNRPKDAFWITVTAAIANILLDIYLIPAIGITGAAVATLVAITINAVGALILLSRIISLKFEYNQVKNILYASGLMGVFLLCIDFLIPFTHIITVLLMVITGALMYIVVFLKSTKKYVSKSGIFLLILAFRCRSGLSNFSYGIVRNRMCFLSINWRFQQWFNFSNDFLSNKFFLTEE